MIKIKRKFIVKSIIYIVTVIVVVIFLVPILWVFLGGIRDPVELFNYPPHIWGKFTLKNFLYAFSGEVMLQNYLRNSAIYAILSTFISLLVGLPAGYAMARSRIKFTSIFTYTILVIRAIPPISLIVPMYLIFNMIGLIGTYPAVIIAYIALHIPFVVWMMRGFFLEIDQELIDASYIDGCSKFSTFYRIALPLSLPGIVVIAIFCLMGSWNELMYALILTNKDTCSVPVFIGSFYTDTNISYGMLYASSTIALTPLFALTFFLQRYIVRGLAFGGIKE